MMVVKNSLIPFKGFVAINLFGIVFVRKDYEFRSIADYLGIEVIGNIHDNPELLQ